jgi:hypothetical protein
MSRLPKPTSVYQNPATRYERKGRDGRYPENRSTVYSFLFSVNSLLSNKGYYLFLVI